MTSIGVKIWNIDSGEILGEIKSSYSYGGMIKINKDLFAYSDGDDVTLYNFNKLEIVKTFHVRCVMTELIQDNLILCDDGNALNIDNGEIIETKFKEIYKQDYEHGFCLKLKLTKTCSLVVQMKAKW